MAQRRFQVSEQERQGFPEAEGATGAAYELKGLQAVRWYGSGISSPQIRRLVGCAERSIGQWGQGYRQQGLAGLPSQWPGENALKLSRVQRADLKQGVQQMWPEQAISAAVRISQGQFWRVSDLQIVVQPWYGVQYVARVRSALAGRMRVELAAYAKGLAVAARCAKAG
jgi:transposase